MNVQITDLRPYKSLILGRIRDDGGDKIVNEIVKDFRDLLGFENNSDLQIVTERRTRTFEVSHQDSSEPDKVYVKFLHYEERRAPSWYIGNEDLSDILNHLVVVCQRKRHIAIYLSDSRRRTAVIRQIKRGNGQGFRAVELIDSGLLNAAFVKGPTRTVWLSGIHARVPVKADSKTLSGIDLRDALDPLGDQTYYFTAARSSVPHLQLPIGVSPRGSRIWAGATTNWEDFIKTVARLLCYLEATTEPDPTPLPVVAMPSTKVPDLGEAFEFHFLPPELLAEDPSIDPEIQEMMERWSYRANFEIEKISDSCLQAAAKLDGIPLGTLELVFDTSDPGNIRITSSKVKPDETCPEEYREYVKELRRVSRKTSWIKVWYESGHTITDGAIFEVRHRDEAFDGFRWVDFSGYQVTTEKFWTGKFPENAEELIGTKGSLFCWVKSEWTNPSDPLTTAGGWLACDDGAMEIADFIHLEDEGDVPVLSLIHVKGAKSDKRSRGISVSSYEVVTGQAVKNLRFLDRLHLDVGLREGLDKKIGKLVWYDRELRTRDEMLDAIDRIGTSYRRMVVVLQPHIMRSKLDEVRKDHTHKEQGRLRQLDTLLLSAQASCRNLGAEFIVLADRA